MSTSQAQVRLSNHTNAEHPILGSIYKPFAKLGQRNG